MGFSLVAINILESFICEQALWQFGNIVPMKSWQVVSPISGVLWSGLDNDENKKACKFNDLQASVLF